MAIPGLVPVNTPAGILMMAPNMAAEVAPYVDPVLGDPNLVAQGALPQPEPAPISLPAGSPIASTGTPEQDRQQLATAMGTVDTSQLAIPARAAAQPPQAMAGGMAPQGPSELERLLANPPPTTATSSTRRTSIPITGPNRQAIDAANQGLIEAEQKTAQAIGAQADAQTAQARLEAEQAEQMARTEAARRTRQDAIINDARAKREFAWMKVPEKLDPNRWDKTGGPARILGAIGVLLGGISSGITGRDNAAKALIDGIVRDDMEVQRSEIELAQQKAQRADNELQDYLDLYGDPILAEKQLEISANGAFIKELQAVMQSAQGEQVKAAAAAGIAERQAEVARLNNEMDGRVGEMVTQSQTNPELEMGIWKTQVGTLADQQAAQNDPFYGMNEASKRDAISRIVALPDGRQAFATTTADAQVTNKLIGARARYVSNMEELRKIIRENVGKNLSPELRGRMKAIVQENKIALKDTNELGAITASDAELVTPLSGEGLLNLTSFDSSTLGALDEAQKYVDAQLTHRMGNLYTDPMARPGSQVRSVGTGKSGIAGTELD